MANDLSGYREYEREFLSISSQLPLRINSVMAYTNDNEANAELRKIEADMTQARSRLQDMEMEARGMTGATRTELGNKVSATLCGQGRRQRNGNAGELSIHECN
jgi:Vesicle transport v-SNARE protein N-terminus